MISELLTSVTCQIDLVSHQFKRGVMKCVVSTYLYALFNSKPDNCDAVATRQI